MNAAYWLEYRGLYQVAVTTAVILIVAAENPQAAWQQPLLRLADTVAGVAVGIACKWITSFFSPTSVEKK